MDVMEQRPPYVRFEQRAIQDGEKTRETGLYSYRDAIFALITPSGSKDVFEQEATDWLAKQKKHADAGRIPHEHYEYFKRSYDRFQEGLETPEEGYPIKGWAAISPAQQAQVLEANVRTVEDLANANEDALEMIGMGARGLQAKAEAWVKSSDQGKAATELQEMQAKLEESERAREKQSALIDEMAARLEALESAKSLDKTTPDQSQRNTPSEDVQYNKDGSVRKKPGRKKVA